MTEKEHEHQTSEQTGENSGIPKIPKKIVKKNHLPEICQNMIR